VPGPPVCPDALDPVEELGLDRGGEPGGLLLFVGLALVADDPAGIERVDEDLGEPRLR
jgi:hypothetical protein